MEMLPYLKYAIQSHRFQTGNKIISKIKKNYQEVILKISYSYSNSIFHQVYHHVYKLTFLYHVLVFDEGGHLGEAFVGHASEQEVPAKKIFLLFMIENWFKSG